MKKKVKHNIYTDYFKRIIDVTLCVGGLIVLFPLFALISFAIVIDDPGGVLFTQKRVGKGKSLFLLHKFRTMKINAPHDIPTHMLDHPDQYITRVGRFLRKSSLDELPQIWDILRGKMSIIGPRPALWNQEDLIEERDKYGANDVMPGLTGWAQINGRDELEIADKAALDGEYVEKQGLAFDVKCFLGTIKSVFMREGIIEGRTGDGYKESCQSICKKDAETIFGCDLELFVDEEIPKRVLITGAGSYIGESVKCYAKEKYPNLFFETIEMVDGAWRKYDFSPYDCVYHVAGIAHADVGNVSNSVKEKYYAVNTDLAIEVAYKSKAAGVKQFVFMSSMIIYGEAAGYGKEKVITRDTMPTPANFYGDSKWQADKGVRALADENFHVAVLRPPMIYGKGCKGNYPILAKIAKKFPIFPDIDNRRSMIHIDNFCEFVCKLIISGAGGVYFPQNKEYTKTSDMVAEIGKVVGKKIKITILFNPVIRAASYIPGKISGMVNKAFGSFYYDQKLSRYSFEYIVNTLSKSIELTEMDEKNHPIHILLISQYFYPESFRVNDMAAEWVKRGYKVTVLTGIPNYPMGKFFDGYDYRNKRREIWNGVDIIRLSLIPRGQNFIGMIANYASFLVAGRRWVKKNNIKADIVFTFEVSPMTQALIGVWYGKRYKVPTYLYVQDLWPENVETATGIHNKTMIGSIEKMVDWIYRETDVIFTTSPSFVEAIVERNIPVRRDKVFYWPQYAEEFYRPMSAIVPEIDSQDKSFKIAFTGNIGTAQGLEILPKTAKLLKNENVKFVIVGDGRYQAELMKQIGQNSVGNMFIMIPRQPEKRIPEILGACDAGFVSFNKSKLWEMTIPAKLQSYMACGIPIVASAAGETERIITEAGCGICTETGNPEALADGIRNLIESDVKKMGRNAREYFESHFEKKMLMDYFDEKIISI